MSFLRPTKTPAKRARNPATLPTGDKEQPLPRALPTTQQASWKIPTMSQFTAWCKVHPENEHAAMVVKHTHEKTGGGWNGPLLRIFQALTDMQGTNE